MVGHDEPPNQTTEEIAREAEAEIVRAARLAREADKAAGKRHRGWQNDSRASKDEDEDGAASGRYHPKFNRLCPAGRERLRGRSPMLHEGIGQIEWQGEQVYCTLAHDALALRVIVDQLTPSLSKDSEELNVQVMCLHAMLDANKWTDPTLDLGDLR
jgi:hypothetical protein